MKEKAIVLSSGGLDSTTVLAIAIENGFDVYPIRFDYGQRHKAELVASIKVAEHYKIPNEHQKAFQIDLTRIGGSALTDNSIDVPKDRDEDKMTDIPVTYVPARNLIFLSIATAYAEVIGAREIFAGMNQLDFSGYKDCRQEFINAFEIAANLAIKASDEGRSVTIRTPLISLTKAQIISLGTGLNVPYQLTHSCYDPIFVPDKIGYRACGHCDSCILRRKGFEQAGIKDPTIYV